MIVVMAHPSRAEQAEHLAQHVGAVIVWDRCDSENDTGDRAWDAAAQQGDWAIVLQDDALPIEDFNTHAGHALHAAPLTCVSFYTGTVRPRERLVRHAITKADRYGHAWLECTTLLWGVAVAMPTTDAKQYLTADKDDAPYDRRIGNWYRQQGRKIRYTNPSLVDHDDTPSLLQHDRGGVRRAHRVGYPPHWDTPPTPI